MLVHTNFIWNRLSSDQMRMIVHDSRILQTCLNMLFNDSLFFVESSWEFNSCSCLIGASLLGKGSFNLSWYFSQKNRKGTRPHLNCFSHNILTNLFHMIQRITLCQSLARKMKQLLPELESRGHPTGARTRWSDREAACSRSLGVHCSPTSKSEHTQDPCPPKRWGYGFGNWK